MDFNVFEVRFPVQLFPLFTTFSREVQNFVYFSTSIRWISFIFYLVPFIIHKTPQIHVNFSSVPVNTRVLNCLYDYTISIDMRLWVRARKIINTARDPVFASLTCCTHPANRNDPPCVFHPWALLFSQERVDNIAHYDVQFQRTLCSCISDLKVEGKYRK